MGTVHQVLESILPGVQRPARYIGGEWNEVVKDHRSVDLTFALAFPDVYGLGFSFRPREHLTVAFEWDRVEYSAILDSLDQVEFGTTNVVLEDADELHLQRLPSQGRLL